MTKDPNSSRYVTNIQSKTTIKHCHESALMAAAHILVCLTKEGKSIKEIAKDFDNNFELVTVWIDYMAAINWIYKNHDGSNKWTATDNGEEWVEKIPQYNKER
jgi:predicted transcriptional regulator